MTEHTHPVLNKPVFTTEMYIPHYKECEYKNWRIQKMGLGFDHGYVSEVWVMENMPILSRRSKDDPEKWESWMSICPHELESQELCCKYAYGHTVITGLGMGWVAINTALNGKVDKVTVIEFDREVIDLFNNCGALDDLDEEVKKKIEIVEADALKWHPDEKVDFLYADIWLGLIEPSLLEDLHQMQGNINADLIYYWGQELSLYCEIQKKGKAREITADTIKDCAENIIKLPLLLPDEMDYTTFVNKAVEMRKKRRLPLL